MANGATEKANSTIKNTLSYLAEDDRFTWDKQVNLAILAINTAYQSQIMEIPFFLHHSRNARLPFNDLIIKIPYIIYAKEDFETEMALKAFKQVKIMALNDQEASANYYNRKVARETNKINIGS